MKNDNFINSRMQCSAYCTAKKYHMESIFKNLLENKMQPKYFDDMIYVGKKFDDTSKNIDVFYFPFGCCVIWGSSNDEEKKILDWIKKLSDVNFKNTASEVIYYKFDSSIEKSYINEEENEVVLPDDSIFLKLSVSYALAQSAKLSVLEESVSKLIERTSSIQKELSFSGSVSLSKKEISKQMGMLYNQRYQINIHNEILDTPEFFWRRPSYEPLYLLAADCQDIAIRQNILNKRLDMIYELYNLLSSELNHIHSSRMEMIIIILITIEVIIGISHFNVDNYKIFIDGIIKFFS